MEEFNVEEKTEMVRIVLRELEDDCRECLKRISEARSDLENVRTKEDAMKIANKYEFGGFKHLEVF